MSKKSSRRHKKRSPIAMPAMDIAPVVSAVRAHPLRVSLVAAMATVLFYLIATTTFVDAIAISNPDLALRLSPSHPVALLTKAEKLRTELLELTSTDELPTPKPDATNPSGGGLSLPPGEGAEPGSDVQASGAAGANTGTSAPDGSVVAGAVISDQANPDRTSAGTAEEKAPETTAPNPAVETPFGATRDDKETAELKASLRQQIRDIALLVIRSTPINARAYFLLGETAETTDEARKYMTRAVMLSRRETGAVFWLFMDSFSREDHAGTLVQAEYLMRSRPQLIPTVVSYLSRVAASDEGRAKLVAWLTSPGLAVPERSKLRERVLANLPKYVEDARTPLNVMLDLKAANEPPTPDELHPYLTFLISKGFVELSYSTWLQFLPPEVLAKLSYVYNPGFEVEPTKMPFDWQISRPLNATAEIRKSPGRRGQALHIAFESGRAERLSIVQTLLLPAGTYRFNVAFRSDLTGKRGLRWRLSCIYGPRTVVFQTEMVLGRQPEWKQMEETLTVPENKDCVAQTLALVHDARSSSEQLISGEAWFDNVRITVEKTAANVSPATPNPTEPVTAR